jgi:hypothetical protein
MEETDEKKKRTRTEREGKVETFRAFHRAFHSRLGTLSSVYLSVRLGRKKECSCTPHPPPPPSNDGAMSMKNQLITSSAPDQIPILRPSNDG